MRNLSLFISTSADGKIARSNGDTDWVQRPADTGFQAFYEGVDVILMGRIAFEKQLSQGAWPFDNKKTYVFSSTIKNIFGSEIEIVNRNPADFVEDLKDQPGQKIWLFGGAQLIRTLVHENLVDDIILNLHQTILGSGVDLYPLPLHSMFWKLKSSQQLPSGLVQVHYAFNPKS